MLKQTNLIDRGVKYEDGKKETKFIKILLKSG